MSLILRFSKRYLNKKPLIRPLFFNEKARNQPINGEYDFDSGKGDYFFGKPYFVHQKAKDIFYEQVGWIYSSHDQINVVLLKDYIYAADEFGTEASGGEGEVISGLGY